MFYRVKNLEAFKDGNVLGGRFLKPGEVLIVSEEDKLKIEQSGGTLEVLELLVPNPLKKVAVSEPVIEPVVEPVVEEYKEAHWVGEPVEPVKRKAGRPKKVVNVP
jgi:hypothetical protein